MSNLRTARRATGIGRAAKKARSMMLARQIAANPRRTKRQLTHSVPSFASIASLIVGGYAQTIGRVMTGHEPVETLRRLARRGV